MDDQLTKNPQPPRIRAIALATMLAGSLAALTPQPSRESAEKIVHDLIKRRRSDAGTGECHHCGKPFHKKNPGQLYCSKAHSKLAMNIRNLERQKTGSPTVVYETRTVTVDLTPDPPCVDCGQCTCPTGCPSRLP